MTNFRNLVAIGATAACVAVGNSVIAQDDLDDLLNDLAADVPAAEKATTEKKDAAPVEKADDAPAVAATETPAETAEETPAETAEETPAETSEETPAESSDETPAPKAEDESADETPAEEDETPAQPVAEQKVAKPAAPAAKPAAKKPLYPEKDAELIEAMVETATVQVRSLELQAEREMGEAHTCLMNEEWLDMARHYLNAIKLLNDSPKNASNRRECEEGIAEGLYRAALVEYSTGRRERAVKLMEKAVDRRHPKARRQLDSWQRAGDPDANKTDISEIEHVRNDAKYKTMREKNNAHLKRARQLLAQGQIKRALDECELVLVVDEKNMEALRLREQIEDRHQSMLKTERAAARKGMIAAVDEAWRPVYAIDAREIEAVKKDTIKKPVGNRDPERAQEQDILARMKAMKLPTISFKPPTTIIDAIEFFRSASKDFDSPELPLEERGFNFVLNLPKNMKNSSDAGEAAEDKGGFGDDEEEEQASGNTLNAPVIPMINTSNISFYEALKLVCDSVEFKFTIKGPIVMVMHKNASVEEMVTRSYPVLSSFMDHMNSAVDEDMKKMNNGGGFSNSSSSSTDEGGQQERDWKAFFELLGVKWPDGSSIMYIKTIGKLRVRNTYENLAELEQALTEMNADPKLIEIETRFVEVCQEDLNSLGFEWILNSDYTLDVGKTIGKAMGVRNGVFGERINSANAGANQGQATIGGVTVPVASQAATGGSTVNVYENSQGATWIRGEGRKRTIGLNATGGTDDFPGGQRYLSTLGNHVNGQNASTNDRFMRVNAFLGAADLSMILHMLSQRNDTDLLSAPKVLTQSGQEAVMKVVTEYIYPTDYDVQLQSSSSSSGGSNSGGSQSAILAVVEPQSFTMREVGVILDVTPTLTDDGNLIDLELSTQVVDEPTWKNYGMRIPFTGNSSLQSFEGIGGILDGLSSILTTLGASIDNTVKAQFAETAVNSASSALDNLTRTSSDNMTYYDAPMEQPFFHVRSVQSKLSVYPGATVVMGGLITEQRKAIDDKIPFLGDLPFVGRLFRSHAEQTNKRNLLIFVTTRLVDTRGRELRARDSDVHDSDGVVAAPESED